MAISACCSLEILLQYMFLSTVCAMMCYMRSYLLAHATVGLAVIDKGPLQDGSSCTGRK